MDSKFGVGHPESPLFAVSLSRGSRPVLRRIDRCLVPQPSTSVMVSSLVMIASQCIAKKMQNLWKKRWSTLLPGHWLAKRVTFPNIDSSLNVLWFRQFSSENCKSNTRWANACLGWPKRFKLPLAILGWMNYQGLKTTLLSCQKLDIKGIKETKDTYSFRIPFGSEFVVQPSTVKIQHCQFWVAIQTCDPSIEGYLSEIFTQA